LETDVVNDHYICDNGVLFAISKNVDVDNCKIEKYRIPKEGQTRQN
jgi:hypothetical protein